ncbi:unnamed protein product [Polarella glacialis]|uniref:Uncharacterized protein n=1 Tax=Polarella glacialis TaxID=89957 RepID=A0A813J891_POLGL|nr:unnamed protein product [Polarella glacialis]
MLFRSDFQEAEDSVVPPALLDAVLTGRVVLRGVRLVKALRLGRATSAVAAAASVSASWANLGGFALGAGSLAGGLVVCSSLSAVGAVAGAGLAYAVKRLLAPEASSVSGAAPERTAEFYDCPLRLLGSADDVFHLFGASLEFPPEDGLFGEGGGEGVGGETPPADERLIAAGWYAVCVQPGSAFKTE